MHIDLQLLPHPPDRGQISNRSVVVIDVLRATSVIVHALSEGATEILPTGSVEETFQRAKEYPAGTTLLGGERQNRRILLTTTNGTKAFRLVSSGKEVMAACFLNLSSTADRCTKLGHNLLIFLSGDEGGFSFEDAVCGGMLIDRIARKGGSLTLTDASLAARILFQSFEFDLLKALRLSHHGRDLMNLGLGDDLAYCAQADLLPLVPVFRDGVIRGS